MARKRKKRPLLERVLVTDIASEGKALGKVNDKVVFISNTVPGDIVDVQVTRKRKKFYEGFPVKFHYYSDIRVEPFCEHFGICGGCKWQSLPYKEQLFYKQKEVINNLSRIAKVVLPEIYPIIPSPADTFYRNKLEFTFTNKRWLTSEEIESGLEITDNNALGFHVSGRYDKVVDIKKCHLQPDPSNDIRLEIKDYALKNKMSFFDINVQKGFLRTLIIRTSSIGEVMVIISFFTDDMNARNLLFEHLNKKFPSVTSWMYVINSKANDTIMDLDICLYAGRNHIFESMGDLKFKIGPKSFFQTNFKQAFRLYSVVLEFAELTGRETVYDLYTGTGTIANFVAGQANKVVGIENVPEAIDDARENSLINKIDNTVFLSGDIKDIFNVELFEHHGHPDIVITDPPRAGMHSDVVQTLINAAADKIVYVSCNPATQARDINILDVSYRVVKVQPVDMFPHTHHVENIVLLEKR